MASNRASYRRTAKTLAEPVAPLLPFARRLRNSYAREAFIVRIKTLALAVAATVDLDIAADVVVEGPPTLEIYPQTWNRLRLGPGSRIGDGLRLSLRGGVLDVGAGAELRRLGSYLIGGTATVGDDVVLSNGVVLHCADAVSIGEWSIVGEYTTLTDSTHVRTIADEPIKDHFVTSPTFIGRNAWIGAHAVITSGVTVGDHSFVGAGAVVNRDVKPGWLVGGVPARPIREL